ncbi:unnamed protein product [Citrullus colocynthis]|uniref:Uncharacterized protein n=1 Tax=Citrullus colocynthis TaxID=252529 RepID=A0ABP0Y3A3_9ROSI
MDEGNVDGDEVQNNKDKREEPNEDKGGALEVPNVEGVTDTHTTMLDGHVGHLFAVGGYGDPAGIEELIPCGGIHPARSIHVTSSSAARCAGRGNFVLSFSLFPLETHRLRLT